MTNSKEALEALEEVQAFVNESHGISGWHKNGDVCYWSELDIDNYLETIRAALEAQAEKDRVMELMAEALSSAKEELWDCHSYCDPETANNSEAMTWRDCLNALAEYNKLKGE